MDFEGFRFVLLGVLPGPARPAGLRLCAGTLHPGGAPMGGTCTRSLHKKGAPRVATHGPALAHEAGTHGGALAHEPGEIP